MAKPKIIYAADARKAVLSIDPKLAYCIDNIPEVVRCNKCFYWDKAKSNKKGFLICPASGMEITADDFCSYGERKNDGK